MYGVRLLRQETSRKFTMTSIICRCSTYHSLCPAIKHVHQLCFAPQQSLRAWPAQRLSRQSRHEHRLCVHATPGIGDEGVDVAVFRFTLGIPGFDDSNIPRVVGAVIAALVVVNHFLGAQPAAPAQVRAEFLDVTLAVLCFVAPDIEARLRQVSPGRGRAGAGQVAGAQQVFALADQQPDNVKKELAWASFALLKNVNCCSILLLQPGSSRVMLARGAVAESVAVPGDAAATLGRLQQGISQTSVLMKDQQEWLPDASAMRQAGLSSLGFVPSGVQSALVQPIAGSNGAVLLVLADRERALSDKDRRWVAAIASKLQGML